MRRTVARLLVLLRGPLPLVLPVQYTGRVARTLAMLLLVAASSCRVAPSKPVVVAPVGGLRERLDDERVTASHFAHKVLYSWTKVEGARWLAKQDPPRLLRYRVHLRPPDVSFYDVHLKASDDDVMQTLFTSPPLDRTRYAWPNAWGACDGLGEERYGDQLLRIVLRDDAIFARFVPRTDDGLGGLVDDANPYRLGLPEWSFFDLAGHELTRAEALAARARLAAVFHWSPTRERPEDGATYSGYREMVLVNESMIEEWSLGTPAIAFALHDAAETTNATNAAVAATGQVAFDVQQVGALLRLRDPRPPRVRDEWLLTLPFPRPQYLEMGKLTELLKHAEVSQRFERVVSPEPAVSSLRPSK